VKFNKQICKSKYKTEKKEFVSFRAEHAQNNIKFKLIIPLLPIFIIKQNTRKSFLDLYLICIYELYTANNNLLYTLRHLRC